jgi:hypothetical protein
MRAVAGRVDEFGFVDDPVEFAVLAHEAVNGFEHDALAAECPSAFAMAVAPT